MRRKEVLREGHGTAINQRSVLCARDRSAGAYLLLAEIKGSQHRGKGERSCLQVHFINGTEGAQLYGGPDRAEG